MGRKNRLTKILGILILVMTLMIFLAPDVAEARRGGGGFGGRSFGGSRSRSYQTPKRTQPRSSFNNRTATPRATPSSKAASSFGGKRLDGGAKQYTSKYGAPRKTTSQTLTKNGVSQNYVMHSYGGYGSGLMTGYMMGTTSMLWMMPFHPAFYYSRPYYVDNPDGTVGVYPPTFNWSKLFFTIIILAVIVYIIRTVIRNRKNREYSQSSFS
jgi:hypothetical protein